MPKLWKYPIFWTNTDEDKILVSPENNRRLATAFSVEGRSQSEFSSFVHLRFDFFKMEFEYTFMNMKNFFSELGGVGKLAKETLGSFGTLIPFLFFVDLVLLVKKRHEHDHREFEIKRIFRVLTVYKQLAENKQDKSTEDKHRIKKIDA